MWMGPLGNSLSQLSGAAPCASHPSVHMMAAVRRHWNQVTNSGASMSFRLASAALGMSSLLANTRVMDTRKYNPTTQAMRKCSVTAIAAERGGRGGSQPTEPSHSRQPTAAAAATADGEEGERESLRRRTMKVEGGRCRSCQQRTPPSAPLQPTPVVHRRGQQLRSAALLGCAQSEPRGEDRRQASGLSSSQGVELSLSGTRVSHHHPT